MKISFINSLVPPVPPSMLPPNTYIGYLGSGYNKCLKILERFFIVADLHNNESLKSTSWNNFLPSLLGEIILASKLLLNHHVFCNFPRIPLN